MGAIVAAPFRLLRVLEHLLERETAGAAIRAGAAAAGELVQRGRAVVDGAEDGAIANSAADADNHDVLIMNMTFNFPFVKG